MKTRILEREGIKGAGASADKCLKELGLHRYVAEIVSKRVPLSDIDAFLNPDIRDMHSPDLFNDMGKAVDLIHKAVRENRKICVYGDYDVDGICASVILYRTLIRMTPNVSVYIPERNSEGYGIGAENAGRLLAEGTGLLISVDCGSSDAEAVSILKQGGADVIITDHHICTGDIGADAFMNPKCPHEKYPYKDLCGAGVAFKLASALTGRSAFNLIDFAALATVADMVPLSGENRIIAAKGIYKIRKAPDPCLKALLDVTGIDCRDLTSETISFSIAPRINAAGRVESPKTAFSLLSDSDVNPAELERLAKELCSLNAKRQSLQRDMLADAKSMISGRIGNSIVLRSGEWEPGLLGLTAARLVAENCVPVVLLSSRSGQWIGSARSIDSINIHDALSNFASMFSRFGGHSMAAGLTVKDECIDEFSESFTHYMNDTYDHSSLVRRLYYDVEADLSEVDMKLIEDMALLEPYGRSGASVDSNPAPSFLFRGVELTDIRPIGGGAHARFVMHQSGKSLSCVAFNTPAEDIPDIADVTGSLKVSSYSGNIELTAEAAVASDVEF